MKHASVIVLLVLAHIISINMGVQKSVGYINIVLIMVLLLSIYNLYVIDLKAVLLIGLIQDIITTMPIGWHIIQLLIAILVVDKLKALYLLINIRNQIVILSVALVVAQCALILNFVITGREILINYHLMNCVFSVLIAVCGASILKQYYVRFRVTN